MPKSGGLTHFIPFGSVKAMHNLHFYAEKGVIIVASITAVGIILPPRAQRNAKGILEYSLRIWYVGYAARIMGNDE